jgi:hypothetical protein
MVLPKDWDERLDEALKTIKTTKLKKNDANKVKLADEISAWIKQNSGQGGLAKDFSSWMSLKDADVSGKTKPIRDQRRAMMLVRLWYSAWLSAGKTIVQKTDVGDAATMADDKVLDGLDDSIGIAWTDYDKYSAASLDKIFDELKKDPVKWLATNLLTIKGEAKPDPRGGRKHEYSFFYKRDNGTFVLEYNSAMAPIQHTKKSAWLIPVSNWSNVKDAVGKLPGTAVADDVDLAFTTQFTGCTYCFQIDKTKKKLSAAHIDPEKGKGADGESISTELRKPGSAFAAPNDGTFKAFGRVEDIKKDFGYGDGQITIIAVKASAGWGIYMQARDDKMKVVDHRRIDG